MIIRSDKETWTIGRVFERSEIDDVFDLDDPPAITTKIADVISLLFRGGGHRIVLVQRSPVQLGSVVELFITDDALHDQTLKHAIDMALVSLAVTFHWAGRW